MPDLPGYRICSILKYLPSPRDAIVQFIKRQNVDKKSSSPNLVTSSAEASLRGRASLGSDASAQLEHDASTVETTAGSTDGSDIMDRGAETPTADERPRQHHQGEPLRTGGVSMSESPPWPKATSLIDLVWGGKLASMVVCEGCRHVSHTYEDFLDLSLPLRAEDAVSNGLSDRRSSRLRLLSSDRWRMRSAASIRSGTSSPSGRGSKANAVDETRDKILKGTTEDEAFGPDGVALIESELSEGSHVRQRKGPSSTKNPNHGSSSQRDGGESADERPSNSGGWGAWAASLTRGRSIRPASTQPSTKPVVVRLISADERSEDDRETEAIDVPDVASLAIGRRRPASTQPVTTSSGTSLAPEKVSVNGLTAAFEAKTRGSTDLLSELSNASRPNSRSANKTPRNAHNLNNLNRARSTSANRDEGNRHHSSHLSQFWSEAQHSSRHIDKSRTSREHKEPSMQAQYIMRVFGDHRSEFTNLRQGNDISSFVKRVRQQQASTNLVLALRTFASAEVLSDENAFSCKRCWRRLNPVRGRDRERLRSRRMRRGKDASGSEDSDDDDDHDDDHGDHPVAHQRGHSWVSEPGESSLQGARTPAVLLAPQPKRALRSMIDANQMGDTTDDDEEGNRTSQISRSTLPAWVSDESGLEAAEPSTDEDQPEPHPLSSMERATSPHEKAVSNLSMGKSQSIDVAALVPEGPFSRGNNLVTSIDTASQDTGIAQEQSRDRPAAELLALPRNTNNASRRQGHAIDTRASSRASSVADSDFSGNDAARNSSVPISRALKSKRSAQSIPRRALKRYLISELPPTLTFHLKRFQVSSGKNGSFFSSASTSSNFKKIDDVVTFPPWLDMTEWIAPPREEYDRFGKLKPSSDPLVLQRQDDQPLRAVNSWQSDTSNPSSTTMIACSDTDGEMLAAGSGHSEEQGVPGAQGKLDRPRSAIADRPQLHEPRPPIYRLYGVVAHHGSTMQSGHYTAYVLSDRCSKSGREDTQGARDLDEASSKATSGFQPSASGHRRRRSMLERRHKDREQATTAKNHPSDDGGRETAETSAPSSSEASGDVPLTEAKNKAHHVPTMGELAELFDDKRQWVFCSDTTVRAATLDEVLRCKNAYLLAYERVM